LLIIFSIYLAIGAGLALLPFCSHSFRRSIDRMAGCVGIEPGHAQGVWTLGTIAAWPIGLFVLVTGRMMLVKGSYDLTRRSDRSACEKYRSVADVLDIPADRLGSHPHSGS